MAKIDPKDVVILDKPVPAKPLEQAIRDVLVKDSLCELIYDMPFRSIETGETVEYDGAFLLQSTDVKLVANGKELFSVNSDSTDAELAKAADSIKRLRKLPTKEHKTEVIIYWNCLVGDKLSDKSLVRLDYRAETEHEIESTDTLESFKKEFQLDIEQSLSSMWYSKTFEILS